MVIRQTVTSKPALSFLTGTPSSSGMDVQRYIAELQALRTVLLAAQAEQEAQSANMAEVKRKKACSLYFLILYLADRLTYLLPLQSNSM